MADAVSVQKLVDGPRNTILRLLNVSDGTGESVVKKVDIAELSGDVEGDPVEFRIQKVEYHTDGMAVRLFWEADVSKAAALIPSDESGCMDFRKKGGLVNDAGEGKTGSLLLTTIGHGSGDTYDLTLHLTKVY